MSDVSQPGLSVGTDTNPTDPQTAKATLGKAGEQARQAGKQAAGQAAEVANDVRDRATSLAGDAKDSLVSTARNRKAEVADRMDETAKAIHRSGEQLEGHQDWMAHMVERGADELGALAATVRTNDLQGLLGKLEDLAHRQPAVFVGAAMAAGFATMRLGKVAASGASRADLPHMPEMGHGPG